MRRVKNHQTWTWVLLLLFIGLSVVDLRFGLLGFLCMGAPLYQALRGRGKVHCSKYCPRGSLLGRFLKYVSLRWPMPPFLRTRKAKHVLLGWMLVMFSVSLFRAVQQPNVVMAVAGAIFRVMMSSLALGVLMGVLFSPRSWCQVCPMGHSTALITEFKKRRNRGEETPAA
ncbi:MAG: 4Fe-4S binding protein [Bacillota bacterium]|jgi:hypothetical protein